MTDEFNPSLDSKIFYESLELSVINTTYLYKYIYRKMNIHSSIPALKCKDRTFATDNMAKANIFNSFFVSVFTTNNGQLPRWFPDQ